MTARPVALVTGGARGIGRAIAEDLARDHAVAITYVESRDAAEALAEADGITAIRADFREENAIARVAETLRDRFGRLDALVNNAGTVATAPASDPDLAAYAEMFRVNLLAPLGLVGALLPLMPDGGAVLNISSLNARRPPSPAAQACGFAASKAALETATKSLARELGPRGIRVNALAPGPIDVADKLRSEGLRAKIAEETPLGRTGTPEDVARVARFLLSPAAGFVTGEVLAVTGGWGI